MAHFAKLDENNIVIEVIVVSNSDIIDESGQESEQKGIEFCQMLHGPNTVWKQTSYNHNFRGVFAGIGMTYNVETDSFIDPNMPTGPNPTVTIRDPSRSLFDHI